MAAGSGSMTTRRSSATSTRGTCAGDAQRGLGYVILSAQGMFDTPRVFAAISILAVLGVALVGAVSFAERLALPWHYSTGAPGER